MDNVPMIDLFSLKFDDEDDRLMLVALVSCFTSLLPSGGAFTNQY